MRKQTTKRAVSYLRVASTDPRDQREGISRQRQACLREAERLGAAITGEYIDVGASGNDTGRSGLRRLLRSITKQPVEYVITRDQARLARNPIDGMRIMRRIEDAGASIVVAEKGAATSVVMAGLVGRAR
jgi:site-specific DNA recombinase